MPEDGIQKHLIPPEDSFIYQHKQHMQYRHSRTRPWAAHHVGLWRHKHELPSPEEGGQFHAPAALSPGNKPQLPSEYETGWLPQYNEVINLDNWVLRRVTYCVEMQFVRHTFIYDWVVRNSASHWGNPGFKCGSQLPWCKIYLVILRLSRQMTGQCLNLKIKTSFYIILNSLFTDHPNIQCCMVWTDACFVS